MHLQTWRQAKGLTPDQIDLVMDALLTPYVHAQPMELAGEEVATRKSLDLPVQCSVDEREPVTGLQLRADNMVGFWKAARHLP